MQQVPPAGEIERPPIQLNETYYAVKNKPIASWVSVKVIEFTESTMVGGNLIKSYKIKYLNTPYQMVKTITAKHLAYFEPPPVRLTIGTLPKHDFQLFTIFTVIYQQALEL